jgi:hypothetical protein
MGALRGGAGMAGMISTREFGVGSDLVVSEPLIDPTLLGQARQWFLEQRVSHSAVYDIPGTADFSFVTFVLRVQPEKCSRLGATTHVDGLRTSRQKILEP